MAQVILLIEPEAIVCEILLVCLRKLGGWTVVPAASVQDGLNWLMHQQPDVIILDIAELENDSLSFMRTLSHNTTTANIPVLLLINHASWLTSRNLQTHQVAGTIAKPFNPITLPLEMAHLLGWRLDCDRCLPAAKDSSTPDPDLDQHL